MVTRCLRYASRLSLVATVLVAATPSSALAQRHAQPRHAGHSHVIARGYYPGWYYGGWYPWGPYPYPYYPAYGYWVDLTTSVRLEVDQRDAEVFVDGYKAGVVDNFDGTFQRLRLRPGGHEITVFLEGYRTIRENIYLSSGTDRKLKMTMEPLAAGERSEPPPQPAPAWSGPDDDADDRGAMDRPGPGPGPGPQREPEPRSQVQWPPRPIGTLSLGLHPGDAEIFVNGDRWGAGAGQERVAVQLPEGRYRIEVRKAGFMAYTEDVLIRRGATLRLEVRLRPEP